MAYITSLEEARPIYTIRQYNEHVYKIVRFKRSDGFGVYVSADEQGSASTGEKSDPALSRAKRMVFEKALCNQWDYFFTGTLDASRYDRFDLVKFHKDLNEFFKYRRRVYGSDLRFLLVPEKHKDGAWHVHGLISGVPGLELSPFNKQFFDVHGLRQNKKLVASNFLCWRDWMEKFGFCSAAPIRSVIGVSYYITKYINKDLGSRREDVGQHLYYCSRNLNIAEKLCDIYRPIPALDAVCTNEFEFCNTGMIKNADWVFAAEMLEEADFVTDISVDVLRQEPEAAEAVYIDDFYSYENLKMKEFC